MYTICVFDLIIECFLSLKCTISNECIHFIQKIHAIFFVFSGSRILSLKKRDSHIHQQLYIARTQHIIKTKGNDNECVELTKIYMYGNAMQTLEKSRKWKENQYVPFKYVVYSWNKFKVSYKEMDEYEQNDQKKNDNARKTVFMCALRKRWNWYIVEYI